MSQMVALFLLILTPNTELLTPNSGDFDAALDQRNLQTV
jgi:hypothetical protein